MQDTAFTWQMDQGAGSDALDASTFGLLARCVESRTVEPRDPSSEAIAEFQDTVARLRRAHERRLIDAWFSPPSRSPSHKGAVVFVVINEILPRGKERMQAYEEARAAPLPESAPSKKSVTPSDRARPKPDETTVLI